MPPQVLGIARGAMDLEMPSSGGTTDAQLIAAAKSDAEVLLSKHAGPTLVQHVPIDLLILR